MSDKRSYRTFMPKQKLEIVLAGLKGDRSVRNICREHEISENLYCSWRDPLVEAGAEQRQGETELRKRIAELERTLGRKTYELEIAGKLLRDWE